MVRGTLPVPLRFAPRMAAGPVIMPRSSVPAMVRVTPRTSKLVGMSPMVSVAWPDGLSVTPRTTMPLSIRPRDSASAPTWGQELPYHVPP